MYKIKMICYNPDGTHFEDEPTMNGPWNTFEEAYTAAYDMAEYESESLNDGAIDGVSFGVVEDKSNDCVRVLYYYNEDENDETGNTEQVTIYLVERVEEELAMDMENVLCIDDITGTIGEWLDMDTSDIPTEAVRMLQEAYNICTKEA